MPQSNRNRNWRSRYRSMSDLSMRHNGAFVGILNSQGIYEPYQCIGVEGSLRSDPQLSVQTVSRDPHQRYVSLSDEALMMDKPEVGMANVKCESSNKLVAMWCAGAAHRQIKRSLTRNMLERTIIGDIPRIFSMHVELGSSGSRQANNMALALHSWFNSEYPTLAVALAQIMGGEAFSVAFSRKFAVSALASGGLGLYYKTTLVGYIDDDNSPILFTNNMFLRESLEEELC